MSTYVCGIVYLCTIVWTGVCLYRMNVHVGVWGETQLIPHRKIVPLLRPERGKSLIYGEFHIDSECLTPLISWPLLSFCAPACQATVTMIHHIHSYLFISVGLHNFKQIHSGESKCSLPGFECVRKKCSYLMHLQSILHWLSLLDNSIMIKVFKTQRLCSHCRPKI